MFQANFDHFNIESKDKSSVEPSKLSGIKIEIEVEIEIELEIEWIRVRVELDCQNRVESNWTGIAFDKIIELKSYLA